MKIAKSTLFWAIIIALSNCASQAQTVAAPSIVAPPRQSRIVTNMTPVNPAAAPAITPQNMPPVLGSSPTTPALGPQNVRPVITPPAPALGQPRPTAVAPSQGFTTGIGHRARTAIGQQGSVGVGQQGFGTAIARQGGTPAVSANGIVIGQPGPFTPPPAAPSSPVGLGANIVPPNGAAQVPALSTATPILVRPAPTAPMNSSAPIRPGPPVVPTPLGRR
jgi:hypothetical protein